MYMWAFLSGFSPVYTAGGHTIKHLFQLLVLICLLSRGVSAWRMQGEIDSAPPNLILETQPKLLDVCATSHMQYHTLP